MRWLTKARTVASTVSLQWSLLSSGLLLPAFPLMNGNAPWYLIEFVEGVLGAVRVQFQERLEDSQAVFK